MVSNKILTDKTSYASNFQLDAFGMASFDVFS